MTWVFPVEGERMAHGHATVTPLALDLAIISGTFNGHWDRDNIGRIMIDPPKGSTIRSPFASKIDKATSVSSGSVFQLVGSGRVYNADRSLTITTQDARLMVSAMASFRLADTTWTAGYIPYDLAFGVEVDGRVVWHSGFERVSLAGTLAGAYNVDVSFPRFTVPVDVAAGSHYIVGFIDYIRGTASVAGADVDPNACRFLETALLVEECRR